MRSNKKLILTVMFMLLMGVCLLVDGKTVFATNENWYEDYTYTLELKSEGSDDNYIVLKEYTMSADVIYVPATAVIEGVTYYTKLDPTEYGIWYNTKHSLSEITFENGCKVADGNHLFYGLSKLKKVNTQALDMSQATVTAWMFANCKSLTKLNVANWDVSNVTNMFNMFGGCEQLASIDVSKWTPRM